MEDVLSVGSSQSYAMESTWLSMFYVYCPGNTQSYYYLLNNSSLYWHTCWNSSYIISWNKALDFEFKPQYFYLSVMPSDCALWVGGILQKLDGKGHFYWHVISSMKILEEY